MSNTEELKRIKSLLDANPYPLVFVDLKHTIRYVNKKAAEHYGERGFSDLVGKSLFDCHQPSSVQRLQELIKAMLHQKKEIFIGVNVRNQRAYLTPVFDDQKNCIGYYERFEANEGC